MKLEAFLANSFFCSKFGKEMSYGECIKKYTRAGVPCANCANGKILAKKKIILTKEKRKKQEEKAEKTKQRAKEKKEKDTKKEARKKALQHFEGVYQRLPSETKMTEYRPFLIFLFHEESNGRILYNRYPDVIEASGCHTRRVEFGGICYDDWLTGIQRYSFVQMGETLENTLLNGRIRHVRRISPNIETFNEMCHWLGLNKLKIKPRTKTPTAP